LFLASASPFCIPAPALTVHCLLSTVHLHFWS